MQPRPLTPEETTFRVETDLARLADNQPPLDGPLTLHGAMARALAHNLDARVRIMEQSLSMRQVELARLGLLPALTGRYGVDMRNNVQGSSSRSVESGRESLSASTSSDRSRRSGSLGPTWQMLDFGVSYYGAKQQSDRALIAHERRRKAVHGVLAEVRRAWWRAVAGERALARLAPLMDRVRAALADSERIAARQVQSAVEALRWQRALLEAVDELERQRREIRITKIELAVLVGLAPGADYALAVPASMHEPGPLALDADELAALALAHRPELREGHLDERIAASEVTKAMLRLLPGLELRASANTDSNTFLVNSDWLSLGAAVSVNLTEIFTRPAARREALSIAVLAQLHVALASFEEARARHATADRIAAIERRIFEVLRSRGRRGAADRLQTVRAQIDAQRALLTRDLGRAEVENSFGRIFLAVGADIAPGRAATLADVAAAIAATEEAWQRGAIFMQPWGATQAPAGGGP